MVEDKIATKYYKTQRERLAKIRDNTGHRTFGIEWALRMALQLLAFVVPSGWVKCYTDGDLLLRRRKHIEIFAFFKVVYVFAVVYFDIARTWLNLIIISLFALDTLHALLCRIFLDKEWREQVSYKRNLIMAFVNYVELIFFFAGVYSFCDYHQDPTKSAAFVINTMIDVGNHHLTPAQDIYYSFVTATTVGYGDISAASTWAQAIVCFQVMISLFFVVVIITNMMANFSKLGLANKQDNDKAESENAN
ncbi:MAG: potassium channel family protein [Mucilaginibacter sp.]